MATPPNNHPLESVVAIIYLSSCSSCRPRRLRYESIEWFAKRRVVNRPKNQKGLAAKGAAARVREISCSRRTMKLQCTKGICALSLFQSYSCSICSGLCCTKSLSYFVLSTVALHTTWCVPGLKSLQNALKVALL